MGGESRKLEAGSWKWGVVSEKKVKSKKYKV